MQELRLEQRVLHDGTEKTIAEIHGDVVILSDNSCISVAQVVTIDAAAPIAPVAETPEDARVAQMQADGKTALRRNIEELNEESTAVDVFAIIKEVDLNIDILALESTTVEATKKKLLHLAVSTGKIDPKKCEECGQTVPE